ncbi:MAG: hypothetical protein ACREJC_08550 [Tepidisphaeraceae bacterium]
MRTVLLSMCCVAAIAVWSFARSENPKPDPLSSMKALIGTWEMEKPGPDGQTGSTVEFKVTSAGNTIMETMFPGSDHEMINMYHMNGDDMIVTHYCAMGVQPRMKLVKSEDGVLRFEFFDCTNLPSRDSGHMDSLELTIKGDKLTEDWTFYQDGKVTQHTKFDLKRKA